MCITQCVHSEGCKLTIPITLENDPSRKEIPTLSEPIEPSTCCNFIFDVALFFDFYFLIKSLNGIIIIYFL